MTTPGTINGMSPQTAMTLGVLLQRISGHQKKLDKPIPAGTSVREVALGLIKEVDPGYKLPADVAVADLERRLRAEAAQTRQAEHQQRQRNRMAKDRKELVASHGEDVVKDIEEKILKAKPNLTYQEAAVLHAAKDGPALPPSREPLPKFRHGQTWEFPDLPGLMQNADKAATDMAYSMIDAFHAGQRP